jgi:hypothetical protein
MGLDFIRRRAKTFTKTWSRNRTDLARPTLFTRYPECRSRSVIADLASDAGISQGTRVLVCARGAELLLVSGTTQIGAASRPPSDLLSAIHQAGGNALGHVTRINPISGTADVEIE